MAFIFDREKTVRQQMIKGFSLLSCCALLSVFLVALIVVLALASATSTTAESNLEARLKDHSLLTTKEIARVIGQKLDLISETVVMTLAAQSTALLSLKVGGSTPDAASWPYAYRPVLRDYTLCEQDAVDATYIEIQRWCSKGFAETSDVTGLARGSGCGAEPYTKGAGWKQTNECLLQTGSTLQNGSGGFCSIFQYTTEDDCVNANPAGVWTTNAAMATRVGWNTGANRIARAAPPGGSQADSTQLGSEEVASVAIQKSTAGCNNDPRKNMSFLSGSGGCNAPGGNCCNVDTYSARTKADWDALLADNEAGIGSSRSFSNVVDRTQMIDVYVKPLWSEYPESLALAYAAYQSPRMAYDADGTPSAKSREYLAAMRRFPGQFSLNNSYDPTKRGWWKAAMARYIENEDQVIMTSAYRDFTTRVWMVTISKAFEWDEYGSMPDGRGVASADVELEDIQNTVLDIDFPNGFAGLIHLQTGAVLSLNQQTIDDPQCKQTEFAETQKCRDTQTLLEIEGNFPEEDFSRLQAGESGTVEYQRATGEGGEMEDWVVAYAPSFNDELGVLLFASKDEIKNTVAQLADKVGETTGTVVGVVVGVVLVTALITFLVVWLVIRQISMPLKNIQKVSSKIVSTSADTNRNFRSHLKKIENVDKGDEIGELVHEFRKMVRGLHDADVKKRKAPKYPNNELYGKRNMPWEAKLNLRSNF